MAKPIDVVIADKNPLVLSGLKQLVAGDKRFRLMATATDGERFLEALDRIDFDVGVIGWVMPYMDGRSVLASLRDRPRAPRVIVYTGSADQDVPRQVMALGGAGFCSKAEPPERLLETIVTVAGGRMVFPLIDVRTLHHNPLSGLTTRERDLLEALAAGSTNAEIARRLGISVNTVKFHLKNLYEKIDVNNRAKAVAFYVSSQRFVE